MKPTWSPPIEHGVAASHAKLPDTAFAFPRQRKEALTDASHVRDAIAHFSQVTDVSDADRVLALANIKRAAEHYQVDMSEDTWHDLAPRTGPQK